MTTKRALLLAGASLIVGVVISALLTARFYQREMRNYFIGSAAAGMGYNHSALSWLRAGNTNAALQSLENELDGQILVLHSLLKKVPDDDRYKSYRIVLENVRSYRAAHPGAGAIVFPK